MGAPFFCLNQDSQDLRIFRIPGKAWLKKSWKSFNPVNPGSGFMYFVLMKSIFQDNILWL
ncbi:Uncharacterized protein dnl_26230 [Desulfonema limicola]|uniref:Uncharacterized protein n=1 Tax=Desulfonema limicola TaxID=45656 RepID=A0A975GGJ6_9BACT|nr:Uncharacterized protein dnl_26230 [Desulfonema limicola]